MYYIYKIAYQISDEIQLRKENEKPFYWEQIHPEVREKSLEEVEQYLVGGGLSDEKLKEMTKNEKYMAVSEGLYATELAEKTSRLTELEAAKAINDESSFLTPSSSTGTTPTIDNGIEDLNPGVATPGDSDFKAASKPDDDFTPMAENPKKANEPGLGSDPKPILEEPDILSPPSKKVGSPISVPATGGGAAGSHMKKDAMVIVKNAVDQMNLVERDPESQAALVQNVIDELTKAKQSLYI